MAFFPLVYAYSFSHMKLILVCFSIFGVCSKKLHCHVGSVEERGFTYANCAKGILPYNGRLCMTLLPLTPAFVLLARETGHVSSSFFFLFLFSFHVYKVI